MNARRVHFHANTAKREAAIAAAELREMLPQLGLEEAERGEDADAIIALGGDGTILRAAKRHPGKPVAGFNLGGLGYLASVERRDFGKALAAIAAGRFSVSRRTMLDAFKPGAKTATALNDIVLVRELSGHAAVLDLEIDGRPAARYLGDGLVFATPTGSTAYSLAAGGPVLMPDSACIAITPMNPHALGIRPIVAGDTITAVVSVRTRDAGRDAGIGVYADGEPVFMLKPGETATIRKSPSEALLVEFDGKGPYEVLSRKLGWTGGDGASAAR